MTVKNNFGIYALCLLMLAFFFGCSSDDDPTNPPPSGVNETIGSTGGTIEISDEASLTIGAGVLGSDINFTMADAGSNHTGMVSVRSLGSAVYSIGPSGTTFADPVLLTLHYDEADLNGVAENTILIYTDSGSGWVALPTTVNEVENFATAEITHLSDFAVTTPAGQAADGVFALFEVVRLINSPLKDIPIPTTDVILARFDGVVNMCSPVEPVFTDSVYCNTFAMSYDDDLRAYIDENTESSFLTLGADYTFHVEGNASVPDLERTITMVEHAPFFNNVQNMDPVSSQGFTVNWNDTSDDLVTIVLALAHEDLFVREVLNNGSFTFTEADLAGFHAGTYILTLSLQNKILLDDEPGYDPNSYLTAYTYDVKLVNLITQPGLIGSAGGTLALGTDGRLQIPAGALAENVLFEAEINSSPPAGPEGYTLLSPVYSIEPEGTVFSRNSYLRFNYDEAALGDASESTIKIFTNTGSGWEDLDGLVMEESNYVESEIGHLSDFVAAFPTPVVSEGIFAELNVQMIFTNLGDKIMSGTDLLFARFDAVYAEDPVTALQAGSVSFGEWPLVWDDDSYSYADFGTPQFLSLDHSYDFQVVGNAAVPSLNVPVRTMAEEHFITNLAVMQEVPLTGFTVEWCGAGSGATVDLFVVRMGGGLNITVPNTGSYSFTEAQFATLSPGTGQIALSWEEEAGITATGFDSHSRVLLTTSNTNHVVFTSDAIVEENSYTLTPHLTIPDRIDGQSPVPVTSSINVMATGVVDSVRVYLDISHQYSSDLTLKLTSPDGTLLRVFWIGEGGEPQVNPVGWYPGDFIPKDDLNGFDGENINGQWTLTATDNSFGQGGTLNEWRLQLFYVE